jgi:hypothetical protein
VPATEARRTRTAGSSTLGGMARINDVGGLTGFPAIVQEIDEPPFHADWEAHVFAMNRALIGAGVYNLDEFRDAVERMPPEAYLASSYYEKWLHAITTLIVEKGVVSGEELDAATR